MLHQRARLRASLGVLSAYALVFEYAVYAASRAFLWPPVFKHEAQLRLLLVAGPGLDARRGLLDLAAWDRERFVRRTFADALTHVGPHAVVFLGDVYRSRGQPDAHMGLHFADVFSLRRTSRGHEDAFELPGVLKVHVLPGETDVGRDFGDPQTMAATRAFKAVFGNATAFRLKGKYDFYTADLLSRESPELNATSMLGTSPDGAVSVLLSHLPVLPMLSPRLNTTLARIQPSVVFSAHERSSVLVRAHKSDLTDFSSVINADSENGGLERVILTDETYLELVVPPCSYGATLFPGYGVAVFSGDKLLDHGVLWTPMRTTHLWGYLPVLAYAAALLSFGCTTSATLGALLWRPRRHRL
ncbi:hypothetical protein HPB47_026682 [Ixodes persulcatus]|uniref:Uncharacterized protein n=1 Tax=Ixodes persulcatus TaxID=34615 RepID=A0AC60PYE1_IXOPE|nr:hypothetical protein HPB47_026682 [Ixodes persulcatus]